MTQYNYKLSLPVSNAISIWLVSIIINLFLMKKSDSQMEATKFNFFGLLTVYGVI